MISRSSYVLGSAIAVSLLLHLGVAAFVLQTPKVSLGEAALAGEGGVEVGLGQAGSYSAVVPTKNKSMTAAKTEPDKKKKVADKPLSKTPPKKPVAKREKSRDITPQISKPEKQEKVVVEKAPVIVDETLVQDASATQAVVPEQKHASYSDSVTEEHKREADKENYDEEFAEPEQKASVKATGRSDHKKSGARKGDSRHYYGEIMAWLTQYKDYPASLKKKKKEGVVTVQFTIDRMGNVLRKKIIKSSGIEGLDNAALAMLDAASPVPSMPRWMKKEELTIALPIEYSLVTNKSFRRKHER